jgi:carbohydrate diacid regulator
MAKEFTTEELLQQLQQETGIAFSIQTGEDPEQDRIQLQQMLKALRASGTRASFLQHFLLGQVDAVDYAAALRRFHIEKEHCRVLFLVRFEKDYSPMELSVLSNIYNASSCDLVQMSDRDIAVIRKLSTQENDNLQSMAEELCSILQTETLQNISVSYDAVTPDFDGLTDSYKNALLAMKVGETFYSERHIYAYAELGLGSLLYQIPREACLTYLNRTLPGLDFRQLDAETLNTIKTFFACNLNIAETARALYMHRNTLVYRLDTFKKQTGLDIRKFEDAINCQIGLLLWEMI